MTSVETFRPLPEMTVLSDPREIPGVGRLPVHAPGTEPFTGPGQRALEGMLAGFPPG